MTKVYHMTETVPFVVDHALTRAFFHCVRDFKAVQMNELPSLNLGTNTLRGWTGSKRRGSNQNQSGTKSKIEVGYFYSNQMVEESSLGLQEPRISSKVT